MRMPSDVGVVSRTLRDQRLLYVAARQDRKTLTVLVACTTKRLEANDAKADSARVRR